jgi:hypothetical protein
MLCAHIFISSTCQLLSIPKNESLLKGCKFQLKEEAKEAIIAAFKEL